RDTGTFEQRRSLRRPGGAIERRHDRRRDLQDAERQTHGERELGLEVSDPVASFLEARELRRRRDRVVEIAELVDEPALERRLAGPYPAARDRVDLLERSAAMAGDLPDELVVQLPDRLIEDVAHVPA